MGLKIIIKDNENVPKALRRFKKACEKEGLNREFRRHEYYEKPSQIRRRKIAKAIQNIKRQEAERKSQNSAW
jgi:small subunit ribosomal protein S21